MNGNKTYGGHRIRKEDDYEPNKHEHKEKTGEGTLAIASRAE